MRKSLLITSALGLVSALPTFAMANAAAAGSSSAACASGFFAQIDAKIMNAKLEIKNEKKNVLVEENASTKEEDIITSLKDRFINDLGNANLVGVFDFDVGATTAEKQALLRAIFGYTLNDTGTETRVQLRARLDATITALNGAGVTAAAITNDIREKLVDSIIVLRNLGTDAKMDNTTTLGVVIPTRAMKLGDVEFINRGANSIAGVVTALTPNEITSASRTIGGAPVNVPGEDFRGIKKIYVLGTDNTGTTLDETALTQAFQTAVKDPAFSTALNATIATSVPFANLVKEEQNSRDKINAQLNVRRTLADLTDRRIHHHALAGGVGATAGWWQNMGGFAISISGTGDYLWGTFRTMDDASGSSVKAQDKRKLGFGFQGDLGLHYVVSPSTTLGILVGFRGQQLNIGRTDKTATTSSKDSTGDYASKWMWNPVVSAQARTFFTDTVYGALTVGYVIPISERDYKLENTNIVNKDAKVRFQGLTGAFSVGMMF